MTTLAEAREAIYLAFTTAWASTTAITLDNETFEPPVGAPWVRVSIRHTASTQETLGRPGNRKFSRLGSAFVQVFTLSNTGRTLADTLASQAREVFEGITLAGTTVRFQDVIIREAGPDGEWYQIVVEATFEYDEIR